MEVNAKNVPLKIEEGKEPEYIGKLVYLKSGHWDNYKLKNNRYVNKVPQSPLMAITEIVRAERKGDISKKMQPEKEYRVTCQWFSHKTHEFESKQFRSELLAEFMGFGSNLAIESAIQIGDVVRYRTAADFSTIKSNNSSEAADIDNNAWEFLQREDIKHQPISNLPTEKFFKVLEQIVRPNMAFMYGDNAVPNLVVIDFGLEKETAPLYSKEGKLKRWKDAADDWVKCMYYNAIAAKYAEVYLPLSTLKLPSDPRYKKNDDKSQDE